MALLDLQMLPLGKPDYLAGNQAKATSHASLFLCPSMMTVIFC
ncbi:SapB/AmfS family lanthipeptide [Streptomyces sp. NPDC020379]